MSKTSKKKHGKIGFATVDDCEIRSTSWKRWFIPLFTGFQTSQIGGAGFLPSTKNHHIIWNYQTSLRFCNVSKDIAFFPEWTGQIWDPGQSFKPWNCLDKSQQKTPINNLSHEDLWMVDWWIHETSWGYFHIGWVVQQEKPGQAKNKKHTHLTWPWRFHLIFISCLGEFDDIHSLRTQ